jgi:hypothetical protein
MQSLFLVTKGIFCFSNGSPAKGSALMSWRKEMSFIPAGVHHAARRRQPDPVKMSPRQRMLGMILRTVFIAALLVVIFHVSMPQSASVWTAYESPGDFVRLALGVIVCLWVGIKLFSMPNDPGAFRTWLYLGLAGIPFVIICLVGIW